MKLKLYTVAAFMSTALLVSCGGNKDKEVVDNSIVPAGSDTAAKQPSVTNGAAPAQITIPGATMPANTVVPGAVNTPVNITQPQTVTMNPQNNTVVTSPQVVTQTPVPTVTQPGMNPPHGQPNHRCDIAVGAPLNSKPAPATAQPTTVSTTPQQPQVTMKEIPNTTKTAPGMNPPHGEPGHRCEIAVGAPLDSKPTTPAATQPATIAPPALISAPKNDNDKN